MFQIHHEDNNWFNALSLIKLIIDYLFVASEELDTAFGKIIKSINNEEGYNPRTINNPCMYFLLIYTICLLFFLLIIWYNIFITIIIIIIIIFFFIF